MKGLVTAIRTLTVIPVPGRESDDFSSSLPWFPVAGLMLGLIFFLAALLWGLLPFEPWTWGGAILILLLSVWLTRGLHMDGLADWADSLGGFGREKRLAIMKDSSIGAFGVIALVMAVVFKLLLFERILSEGSGVWLIVVPAVSRAMLVEMMTTMPSARSGEGMAGPFIGNAKLRHRIVSHALALGICVIPGIAGIVLYVTALVVTFILRSRFMKQFNGVTGDLLGASNEILEIVMLLICALFGGV